MSDKSSSKDDSVRSSEEAEVNEEINNINSQEASSNDHEDEKEQNKAEQVENKKRKKKKIFGADESRQPETDEFKIFLGGLPGKTTKGKIK